MAMLSGPRQRKRYNLVPRGKPLYEDETRFGTKMLEKMGWKKGQGLGANENGSKDFVRVRYKNDACGLGFEQRDDQWTQHEQNFDGLLKTLNNDEGLNIGKLSGNKSEESLQPRVCFGIFENNEKLESTAKVEKMKEKISGVSLEERSKQSKARVHYKKFTKGKDLAQYSEKDLANIFGKKAVDEQQTANDFFHQLNNIFEESSNDVHPINTGVSINDYFDSKIKAKKSRKDNFNIEENSLARNLDSSEDQLVENINKTKQERMKHPDTETNENNIVKEKRHESKVQIFNSNVSVNDYFKMKMEALRNKNKVLNTPENITNDGNSCVEFNQEDANEAQKNSKNNINDLENSSAEQPEKKESKKNKIFGHQEKAVLIEIENKTKDSQNQKKSKRIDEDTMNTLLEETKNRERKEQSQTIIQVDTPNETNVTKKRKLDYSAEISISISSDESCSEMNLAQELKTKKRKKNRTKERNEMTVTVNSDKDNSNDSEKKGKNKKSKKNKEPIETCLNNDSLLTSTQTNIVSNQPSEKPSIAKTKDVSSSTKNEFISDKYFQELDHEEIKEKNKSQRVIQVGPLNENNAKTKKEIVNSEDTISISSDESCSEINLAQELTTKKRKKNKTKERNEMIETRSSDKNKSNDSEKIMSKNKSKRCRESTEVCANKDELINSNQANEVLNQSSEKPSKTKNDKNVCVSDANLQELNLEESKEQYKASNCQTKIQVETSNGNDATKKEKTDNSEKTLISISSDESSSKINFAQELTTEKRKKNKTKERSEMTETHSSDKNKLSDSEKTMGKNKSKRSRESSEICLNKSTSLISNQTNEVLNNQHSATKSKDVGSSDKNVFISDANLHELDLEEIKEKYKAFNIYRISSFCAEKFRNIDLNNFTGSTLPQIEGYGLGPDLQLDVHINKNDEERITNLWKCTLNKYTHLEKPKNVYRKYVREVIRARKSKRKIPKLYVKTWKRKNVFHAI